LKESEKGVLLFFLLIFFLFLADTNARLNKSQGLSLIVIVRGAMCRHYADWLMWVLAGLRVGLLQGIPKQKTLDEDSPQSRERGRGLLCTQRALLDEGDELAFAKDEKVAPRFAGVTRALPAKRSPLSSSWSRARRV